MNLTYRSNRRQPLVEIVGHQLLWFHCAMAHHNIALAYHSRLSSISATTSADVRNVYIVDWNGVVRRGFSYHRHRYKSNNMLFLNYECVILIYTR